MESTQRIQATTTAITIKFICTWTIENYRVIKTKVGESILSPEFSVESDGISHHDYAKRCWGWNKFWDLKNIDELISSKNTITFKCDFEVFKKLESSINSKITDNVDETIHGIKLDSAFLNEEFSDVKLITSDKNSIPAHRIVLAMSSPVFKAMFTHDMLERKNNSIEIPDIPYNILIEMLRYIYTGDIVSTKTDIVLKLLAAADKYQIDNLKIKCEKILCAELSTENALDILEAALKYNVKYLGDEVVKFFEVHIESLIDLEKVNDLVDTSLLNIIKVGRKIPKTDN
ncbi:speckle-type POZ protein A-like [Trichogramma pretiosum]|uniref:speckle-type POZ protein A-like n=1 Tax=Trichogramma pretiosum TaxID=7493 RepID=UPI000C71B375|nr:speckle-type POZ protein A-like [Trichogramma pretiosum]